MKKILVTLLFFGASATGFAQWNITIAGRADIEMPDDDTLIINCNGSGTCVQIIAEDSEVRLLVPDYNLDFQLSACNVNGQPVQSLPSELPNGIYYIDYQRIEE